MVKTFEVVDATGTNHRLTITPERITIKIAKGCEPGAREHIRMLSAQIALQMWDVSKSFRGKFDRKLFGIQMYDDSRRECRYFLFSDGFAVDSKNVKGFRKQFIECRDDGTSEEQGLCEPFKCKRFGGICKSGTCRDSRIAEAVNAEELTPTVCREARKTFHV